MKQTHSIKFFNTMHRRLEEFRPLDKGEARMYTCGPTVYNFAHVGNFRAYVFEDLLRRTLEYFNYRVVQVMNLTDVDDKTIRGSRAAGKSLDEFTAPFKTAFFQDLKTLNIEPAEYYPAATAHIPEMIELIRILVKLGFAYRADDGSVYFAIAKFPEYGKLARIDMANQRAGVRISTDEYAKNAVADFALWKAWSKQDGDVAWESPWGKGRPGWHIECSAMSMKYLGKTFDIHTGGIDNMFPHHEDEIAQSECANGCPYVNYWLHCAHLIVNGEKMAKSANNFFTLRDLTSQGWSGREIRWVLLGTHYRKKLNFTFEALEQGRTILKRFDDFFARLRAVEEPGDENAVRELLDTARTKVSAALADDLNIAEALASLFALQSSVNKLLDTGKLSAAAAQSVLAEFRSFDRVFGTLQVDDAGNNAIPQNVLELAARRQTARKNRDFAKADTLREELLHNGWLVEDTPEGFRVKPV